MSEDFILLTTVGGQDAGYPSNYLDIYYKLNSYDETKFSITIEIEYRTGPGGRNHTNGFNGQEANNPYIQFNDGLIQNYSRDGIALEQNSSEIIYSNTYELTRDEKKEFTLKISGRERIIQDFNLTDNNSGIPVNIEWSGTITIPGVNSYGSKGFVNIYKDGKWNKATPYIFKNGEWKIITPYIFKNGKWNKCI